MASVSSGISPGDHSLTITSSVDGSSQPYRLFIPSEAEKGHALPLAVVLHGKGVDQDAWFDFTPVKKVAENYGFVVAAPNGRGERYYDYPGERDVLDIIGAVKQQVRIDENRIYLAGHSMGGFGTWHIAQQYPDVFASIAPMAGIPEPQRLCNLRYLSPFIIHSNDDPIVHVKNSRVPAARLAQLGISFQYREEHGYGHESRMIGDNLPRVFEWFNKHTRVTNPDRVSYFLVAGGKGKAYWIEVPETNSWYPASVGLDARLCKDDRIVVDVEHIDIFRIDFGKLPRRLKTAEVVIDGTSVSVSSPEGVVTFAKDAQTGIWKAQ